ncbi:hypothetical protein AB833_24815 [Chromatiales bacterium (ex Bugula neritina AB1)]|nr:hypothetical protein AB833_24815 [Chromatiales bacterium (ex Bugula neritina AB1)]
MTIKKFATPLAALVLITLLAACSSGPPPKHELSLTQSSIRSAEAAGAVAYASKPFRSAQQKVTTAQTLIEKKKYDRARRILQSATADAELAEATAEAEQARIASEELNESIALMKEEIARVQDN